MLKAGLAVRWELDTARANATAADGLRKAGDEKDALVHLQRAYELEPQNTTYRMNYEKARVAIQKKN